MIFLTALTLPFMTREPISLPPIVSVELIQISDKTNIPFAPKARKVIDKFPDSNPNPVMRINSKGRLDYFNKSSQHIINNLDLSIKANMPKQILDKIFTEQDEFEIEIADKHYLFNFVKIEELAEPSNK